jgi:hypothetical protein
MPKLPRTARGKQPAYLDARANDDLLRMLLATMQELSVTRERLAAVETLLERAGLLTPQALEALTEDSGFTAAQAQARTALIARLTGPLEAALKQDVG